MNKITKIVWLTACAAAALIPFTAMAGDTATGGEIYQQYCSVCHGDEGDGQSRAQQGLKPPPRDFTDPDLASVLTAERMADAVKNGRAGTAMTPWSSRLSDQQIVAVVNYVLVNFVAGEKNSNADVQSSGALLYAGNCSVCHGDVGSGATWGQASLDPPPRNFTTDDSLAELSRDRMIASVNYGRPGTAMVGFSSQLSELEIIDIVDYVRQELMGLAGDAGNKSLSLPATDTIPTTGVDMQADMPGGLAGDHVRGVALYMQNCVACHGAKGDGEGPRAYFIIPRPRDFLSRASRGTLNRPTLFGAIRNGIPGTEMPAWGTVLEDQQIADVSEYVFRAFIQPESATAAANSR